MLQDHSMASWVPPLTGLIDAEQTKSDHKPPFTAFQLATVDSDGFPRTRTLIFRGFLFGDRNTNVLTATTDKRMSKYSELLHNDRFAAVFWFPTIKKQFRFRGRARIIDDEHTPGETAGSGHDLPYRVLSPSEEVHRDSTCNLQELMARDLQPPTPSEWSAEVRRQWDALSADLRSTFRKPAPGSEITDDSRRLLDSIRRGVDGKKEDSGLKNFAVLALFVDSVDIVELDKDRRFQYDREDGMWVETEVCP